MPHLTELKYISNDVREPQFAPHCIHCNKYCLITYLALLHACDLVRCLGKGVVVTNTDSPSLLCRIGLTNSGKSDLCEDHTLAWFFYNVSQLRFALRDFHAGKSAWTFARVLCSLELQSDVRQPGIIDFAPGNGFSTASNRYDNGQIYETCRREGWSLWMSSALSEFNEMGSPYSQWHQCLILGNEQRNTPLRSQQGQWPGDRAKDWGQSNRISTNPNRRGFLNKSPRSSVKIL